MDLQSLQFQELIDRKQRENESVSSYAYAKLALCNKVNKGMTEKDKLQHFIQGLIPTLRVAWHHQKLRFHGRARGCQKKRECVEIRTRMERQKSEKLRKEIGNRIIG